jgi:2-polyprenyl-3-methyl-5-hydroxy-6-metoxy-1,4-benzoquinol methylase
MKLHIDSRIGLKKCILNKYICKMNDTHQQYFDANKEGWNQRTAVHKTSAFYNLEDFKKGTSSLNKIEVDEVGDVKGKSLLHLQCHFGMDSLSWARAGATVTGVDISDNAIALANEINNELELNARFVCCNVYDTCEHVAEQFDIVFTSYGTIGWLPDLKPWAKVVAQKLKPGGFFYIADFHPTLWMLDDNMEKLTYSYFNDEVIVTEQKGTYTDRDAPIAYTEYGWNHPFSEIISALIAEGLQIEFLHEFPYSPYNCFANLEQSADGYWRFKGMGNRFPMMYSIKAIKPVI